MSQTFPYTAEEIEARLNLIDENKNLLEYQYDSSFPEGLEDIGDGSILTTKNTVSTEPILLKAYSLLAGTYTASVDVTDLIDETKAVANPGFTLKIEGASVNVSGQFTLSAETTISVYLVVPINNFDTGLVIKPQIEKGEEKTDWVPYMDKIGTYVDERFNSTNAKIRYIASNYATKTELDTAIAKAITAVLNNPV